jgi:hypothetical protein
VGQGDQVCWYQGGVNRAFTSRYSITSRYANPTIQFLACVRHRLAEGRRYHATAHRLMVRGLIERHVATSFARTEQGGAVPAALLRERDLREGLLSGADRKTYARSEDYGL